jgi:hypothetical protein
VKFCFLFGKSAALPPYLPNVTPSDFFLFTRMKGQMKGESFAYVSEVKKKTLKVLNIISIQDCQKCFHQYEKRLYNCIGSKGEYFEGDQSCNSTKPNKIK